jgi:hypothetical protein
MRSNCWIWAKLEYWRRKRAWVRAGMPIGQEPYWVKRQSRNEPRCLMHYEVGRRCEDGRIEVESFKPDVPTDAPWWLAWTHMLFRGSVKKGD